MGKLTLLLGGARSGKSTLAEKLAAERSKRVMYVATGIPFDDEMKLRIENHQKDRPDSWKTVESPTGIVDAIRQDLQFFDVVILDCLTLLANNLFLELSREPEHPNEMQFSEALDREIDAILSLIESSPTEWIIVTNEVGLGLVPPYPLGRVYRDLLGRANQRMASRSDNVYFMVAGMAIPLHEIALKL